MTWTVVTEDRDIRVVSSYDELNERYEIAIRRMRILGYILLAVVFIATYKATERRTGSAGVSLYMGAYAAFLGYWALALYEMRMTGGL